VWSRPREGRQSWYRAPAAFSLFTVLLCHGLMGRMPSILGSGAIRGIPRRDSPRLKGMHSRSSSRGFASGIKQSVQLGDFLHPIQFFPNASMVHRPASGRVCAQFGKRKTKSPKEYSPSTLRNKKIYFGNSVTHLNCEGNKWPRCTFHGILFFLISNGA
jgi:hypothetical protein